MFKFIRKLGKNDKPYDEDEIAAYVYKDEQIVETKKTGIFKNKKLHECKIWIESDMYYEVTFNRLFWSDQSKQAVEQLKVKSNYEYDSQQLIIQGRTKDSVEEAGRYLMKHLMAIKDRLQPKNIQTPLRGVDEDVVPLGMMNSQSQPVSPSFTKFDAFYAKPETKTSSLPNVRKLEPVKNASSSSKFRKPSSSDEDDDLARMMEKQLLKSESFQELMNKKTVPDAVQPVTYSPATFESFGSSPMPEIPSLPMVQSLNPIDLTFAEQAAYEDDLPLVQSENSLKEVPEEMFVPNPRSVKSRNKDKRKTLMNLVENNADKNQSIYFHNGTMMQSTHFNLPNKNQAFVEQSELTLQKKSAAPKPVVFGQRERSTSNLQNSYSSNSIASMQQKADKRLKQKRDEFKARQSK